METYKGDSWCVKCKEKVYFDGIVKVSDSGRRMAQGNCPQCSTKVMRILGKEREITIKQEEKKEPYATIEVVHNDGYFHANAYDSRRRGSGFLKAYNTFFSKKREKAIAEAREWIEAYEVIELYKED